jgi:hypothetical protein
MTRPNAAVSHRAPEHVAPGRLSQFWDIPRKADCPGKYRWLRGRATVIIRRHNPVALEPEDVHDRMARHFGSCIHKECLITVSPSSLRTADERLELRTEELRRLEK